MKSESPSALRPTSAPSTPRSWPPWPSQYELLLTFIHATHLRNYGEVDSSSALDLATFTINVGKETLGLLASGFPSGMARYTRCQRYPRTQWHPLSALIASASLVKASRAQEVRQKSNARKEASASRRWPSSAASHGACRADRGRPRSRHTRL